MKKSVFYIMIFILLLNIPIISQAKEYGDLDSDMIGKANEKVDQSTEVINKIDEKELNRFLSEIGVPFDVQQEIDYIVKVKMYESLKDIDGNMKFEGYKSVVANMDNKRDGARDSVIPKTELKFSATYIYVENNLNAYYIYPSFEFGGLGGLTKLYTDTFGFALDSSKWTVRLNSGIDIYDAFGKRYTIDRPSTADFAGCAYALAIPGGTPTSNIWDRGVACIIARPSSTDVDKRIVMRYGQNILTAPQANIGPFSITMPNVYRSAGEVVNFR